MDIPNEINERSKQGKKRLKMVDVSRENAIKIIKGQFHEQKTIQL